MVFNCTLHAELKLRVKDIFLSPQKQVTYLGVVYTNNLTWAPHVEKLAATARRAGGLIRAAWHEPWAKDRATLVGLVMSLVRSRLMYGAEAARDMTWTQLSRLMSVECGLLRLALGLPRSTPAPQVYKEAGVMPLTARLGLSLANFFVRSLVAEGQTKNEIIKESAWRWPKTKRGRQELTMEAQVNPLMEKAGVDPLGVAVVAFAPWPPSWLVDPQICIDLGLHVSKKDNPAALKCAFLEAAARRYAGCQYIYTDGSLTEGGGTGAGVYVPDVDRRLAYRLPKTCVMGAELVAILMALGVVEDSFPPGGPGVVICSDSLSSLQLLRGAEGVYLNLETEILGALTRLARRGVSVTLQWVPAHVGIHGNEVADALARVGAGSPTDSRVKLLEVDFAPSVQDCTTALRRGAWQNWRGEYEKLARARQWPSCLPPSAGTRWCAYPKAVGDCMSRLICDRWRTM